MTRVAADDGGPAHRALRSRARPPRSTTRADDLAVPRPCPRCVAQVSRMIRLASSMSSSLPGVLPPALDHVRTHDVALVDEPLDRVGDLELTARRRPDGLDRLEDRRRRTCRRRPAPDRDGGVLRLLDEPHDAAVAVSTATPNWLGSGTAASRIWQFGLLVAESRRRAARAARGSGCRPGTCRTDRRRGRARETSTAWASPSGASCSM